MSRVTIGQRSLDNFYQSVQYHDVRVAALMSDDIVAVALYSLSEDKTPGQEAANRLREQTRRLPVIFERVLDGALTNLGYE